MASVCLDVFAMPRTEWDEKEFDAILLCVDRLSGWIVAAPTTKEGLTAEHAAHLMWEHGWEMFGILGTIMSDRGAQFTGQWWEPMCARLGIRQTFSQAHRPQSNGRAERAGQQIITWLKKMNVDEGRNWVEALPRALCLYHDTVGEMGHSPYQIMFGRERLLRGIHYSPK